jgi:hypothetical protein
VQDEAQRYNTFTTWHNNSCAYDVLIFCAIKLNVGRVRIDQLNFQSLRALSEPARALRTACLSSWGTIEQDDRDTWRELLRAYTNKSNPQAFPLGQYTDVCTLFEVLLSGTPQIEFTTIRARRNAIGNFKVRRNQHPKRNQAIYLQHINSQQTSIEAGVHEYFNTTSANNNHTFKLVLDRLPPVLVIIPRQGITKGDERYRQLFTPLRVIHQTRQPARTSTLYSPCGSIFHVSDNHFVAAWRSRGIQTDILHYDSMQNTRPSTSTSWWPEKAKQKKTKASILFYYRT